MMATTHALVGVMLAAIWIIIAPEYTSIAMLAGLVGGLFPDVDLYTGHRRTLHFPVYYAIFAAIAFSGALLVSTVETVALAAFLIGAAAHAAMDILGGGLELRPWDASSDRAVYSHYHGQWLRPRRWVPYDGAPEDLALALGVGVPAFVLAPASIDQLIGGAIVISMGYALLRKPLAQLAEQLATLIPAPIRPYVPERYL